MLNNKPNISKLKKKIGIQFCDFAIFRNRFLGAVILSCFLFNSVSSQDLHFSQFFKSPLSTNPANTGFIPDADYRLGIQYRKQFSNIMSSPYKTFSVFGDAQIFRNLFENGWMGLGGLLLNDVAGAGSLQSTKMYGSLAYHQMIANSSLISGGFNLGYVSKRIDPSKLKFPDQFDGKFFDNSLPTNVVLSNTAVSYFDLQAGINYAYFPSENIYINLGYSIHHVNQPRESFFNDQSEEGKLSVRHIAFINGIFKVGKRVILEPNIFYTNQSKASSLVGGLLLNYNLSEFGENELIAGIYYRNQDAIIPMLGLKYKQIKILFSYDATVSPLNKFNNAAGANELSIINSGFYRDHSDRQTICPRF